MEHTFSVVTAVSLLCTSSICVSASVNSRNVLSSSFQQRSVKLVFSINIMSMYYILFISYMLCKLDLLLTGLMDILIIFGFTLLTM